MTAHPNNKTDIAIEKVKVWLAQYNLKVNNPYYYLRAITHSSYANENNVNYNYQRLEFLGDALLQKQVTVYLFFNFFQENEGALTRYRANLVKTDTIALVSQHIKLHELTLFGKGEQKVYKKQKHYCDIYEAMLGAIYLDQGGAVLKTFIDQTLLSYAQKNNFIDKAKNPKTVLQEKAVSIFTGNLVYEIVHEQTLESGATKFHARVKHDKVILGAAAGATKKEAEERAAQNALSKLIVPKEQK